MLLRRLDPERRLEAYRLWSFWDEVVGEAIARRAQPQRIRGGALFVTVSSHTWMQELQFMKEMLREQLNQRLGAPLIKELVLVSGSIPKRRAPKAPTPAPATPLPALPSTGVVELDAVLQRIAAAHSRRQTPPRRTKRRR